MSGWSEDDVHRWLASRPRADVLDGSPGHDAAVLKRFDGRPVVCTDQCVAGVHYDEATTSSGDVGQKTVRRALSDLAATATRPVAVTLTVTAPRACSNEWVIGVVEGAAAAAREYGAELVAGDLAASDGPAVVGATALGSYELDVDPPGRDRATAGQLVVVTGPLGGSLRSGRHLRPVPRFDVATRLVRDLGATAMMDVSDGLAWDVYRLARASSVGIELDATSVPVHADVDSTDGRSVLDHALHDGEDHELIATLDPSRARDAEGFGAVVIGRVLEGSAAEGWGVAIVDDGNRSPWSPGDGGWQHGSV